MKVNFAPRIFPVVTCLVFSPKYQGLQPTVGQKSGERGSMKIATQLLLSPRRNASARRDHQVHVQGALHYSRCPLLPDPCSPTRGRGGRWALVYLLKWFWRCLVVSTCCCKIGRWGVWSHAAFSTTESSPRCARLLFNKTYQCAQSVKNYRQKPKVDLKSCANVGSRTENLHALRLKSVFQGVLVGCLVLTLTKLNKSRKEI